MRFSKEFFHSFLPQSLFGRALMIIVTPLILVQLVTSYVFLDRHLEAITRTFSLNIAGNVRTIIKLLEKNPPGYVKKIAREHMEMQLSFPKKDIRPRKTVTWSEENLEEELKTTLKYPFDLYRSKSLLFIKIHYPKHLVLISFSKNKLFSRTSARVLIWAIAMSILVAIIAILFMNNQIRPIRRLAVAAELFGKGVDIETFKPSGALEVRQAAGAFNLMRERIRRQIRQRTEMLAGVSHDLRTPLTRMKLALEMIDNKTEVRELRSDITDMEKMVEGFLDFVRGGEHEKAVLTNVSVLLNETVEAARQPEEARIKLTCPSHIRASLRKNAFKRCVENLISNAKKYADEITVTLTPNEHQLILTVDDNGPGIPEKKRREVFKPFYRLDTARNLDTPGTGLGLSIAQDVMHSHGGNISLDTSPQGGLRVRLTLPL